MVREAKCKLPTRFGEFNMITYRDTIDNQLHYVLVKGEVQANAMVRVHLQNTFNDLLHSERDEKRSWPLEKAMARIADEGGVLVVLGHQQSNEELVAKVKAFEAEDKGEVGAPAQWQGTSRQVGVGSQILADVGVTSMRLLSSPKRYHSLSGFGLEVTEYIAE